MYLDSVEECSQIQLPYNGIALCGLALDASTIGGQNASIPTMSFLVTRGPIAIPSNYDAANYTFAGTWDGTFTTGVTDDPAWVLWDLLTNSVYGCGVYGITAADLDAGSFYNASVFNSEQVSDGNGGTEPRFRFNAPIQNSQDMLTTLQQVAQMMNANLGVEDGLITLYQDRPTQAMYLINKSCVVGSDDISNASGANPVYFKYTSNTLSDRTTAVDVTWVNASNIQWLPNTTSVTDPTYLAKYGYLSTDLSAFGATTYGQAYRCGKYWLFENLYNTEQVEFELGLQGLGFIVRPDDVFALFDDDYANRSVGGHIVSATSNTVTLCESVIIDPDVTTYLWILAADGVTYTQYTVTNSPGTYQTLTISGTFATIPSKHCLFGLASSIQPRLFRIKDIKIDGTSQTATITARLYDPTNYDYVEGTWSQPTAVYTQPTQAAPTPPSNPMASGTQYINPQNSQLQYGISVSWDRPSQQNIGYVIKWRKDSGQWSSSAEQISNSYQLEPVVDGEYDFLIYSVNLLGQQSAPASVSYTLDTSGGGTSATLSEIQDLYVYGTTGTTWTGTDCEFEWTNPAANQGLLKDFLVTISTTTGTQLRQVVVGPVVGGDAQNYTYTFAMNQSDSAAQSLTGPQRSLLVKVQGMDSQNDLTNGITATLTNSPPPVPSDITATAAQQSCLVTWDPETDNDIQGYIIWLSETNGFTPSSGTATDCGDTAITTFLSLNKSTTYYFKLAAYDVFGKALDGTGLNVSSQLSFTTPTNVGVPSGSTLPASGMSSGDFFYNTSNNSLYKYTGSAWVVVGTASGTTLPSSGTTVGDTFYNTTTGLLYTWNGSAWVAAGITVASSPPSGASAGATYYNSTSGTLYTYSGSAWVAIGIPQGSTLPSSGMVTGDTFYNSSNGILYTYNGSAWVTAGIASGASLPGSGMNQGSLFFDTSNNKLYRYTGSAWTVAVDGGDITAGTVTTSALAAGSVTAATIASGTITSSQIAAGTISGSNIGAGTITASNIATGTLTATQISASTITGSLIAAGTITGSNIAAGTITASNLVAGTITASQIASSTITAGNLNITSLSAISAALGSITSGDIYGADIRGGSFTGWAWPSSGGGFYLGSNGLLLGNANTGGYVEIQSTGQVNMPGLTITGTTATFSGALSAASGTFAGTLTAGAVNAVNTINIAGNAVTTMVSSTSSTGPTGLSSSAWTVLVVSPSVVGDGVSTFQANGVVSNIYNTTTSGSFSVSAQIIRLSSAPSIGGTATPASNSGGLVLSGIPVGAGIWAPAIPCAWNDTPSTGTWYYALIAQQSGSAAINVYGNSFINVIQFKR